MLGFPDGITACLFDLDGVAAGQAGNFACVVGVDRVGHADSLRANGASVVVTDLAEPLDRA